MPPWWERQRVPHDPMLTSPSAAAKYLSFQNKRQRNAWLKPLFAACLVILVLVALTSYHRVDVSRARQLFEEPSKVPRAVILASYSSQNVSWLADLSPDWDYYRYWSDYHGVDSHNDAFNAPLAVPANIGREVMPYLTFIIDNYANLPGYMVFIHGHLSSWHQTMPIHWKLASLNITALDELGYISLNCFPDGVCNKFLNAATGPYGLDRPDERLNRLRSVPPYYHYYWGNDDLLNPDLPTAVGSKSGGQFAVSAKQIRKQPLSYWKALRAPLLSEEALQKFDEELRDVSLAIWGYQGHNRSTLFGTNECCNKVDSRSMGRIFELLWGKVFTGDDVWCPEPQVCDDTHFGGAIQCYRNETESERNRWWKWACDLDQANLTRVDEQNQAILRRQGWLS